MITIRDDELAWIYEVVSTDYLSVRARENMLQRMVSFAEGYCAGYETHSQELRDTSV